ncbi:hypothetical protein C8039_06550 [Halogeometricum sp. wsp3]|nr:hypothetical protein C8039_06550 [Halogeometricum sp. wsp3]
MRTSRRQYASGEHVPSSLTAHTAPDDLRFTTAVDVYAGYGSQWHVYPVESVVSKRDSSRTARRQCVRFRRPYRCS